LGNQEQEPDGHILRRWVSLGDVISLALSIAAIGVTYGNLSADLRHTNETVDAAISAIRELQERDITPGARSSIAALVAKDSAQDQAITELRIEIRDQRREILEALTRVEDKLEDHAARSR